MPDRANWLMVKVVGYLQRGHNREGLLHWAGLMSGEDRSSRETVTRAMHDAIDVGLRALRRRHPRGLPGPLPPAAAARRGTARRELAGHRSPPARSHRGGADARPDLPRPGHRREPGAARPNADPFGSAEGPPARTSARLRRRCSCSSGTTRSTSRGGCALGSWACCVREPGPRRSRPSSHRPVSTPTLQTTEGEELVMCTARYEVPDLDAAWLALSRELDGDGDGEVLHHVVDVPGGQPRGAGHRTPRQRSDRAGDHGSRAAARAAGAGARDRPRCPTRRRVDASGGGRRSPKPVRTCPRRTPLPELAPEDIAALVRQHEDRWLSERIPALGGLTPREAAADPAAREELIALLDDFEWQDRRTPNAFSMDVHRIRAELGLS